MGLSENELANVGVTTCVKLSFRKQTPEWQCRTCLPCAYCQLRQYSQCLNPKLVPLYLMAVLWEMSCCFYLCETFASVWGHGWSCLQCTVWRTELILSDYLLCEDKAFSNLLLLNKPMGCSFLSESMKSMVTLIFKMMLKQKTKSFTG